MISYIYADSLNQLLPLKSEMLHDRRRQFKERQNWDVTVNTDGEEVDEYDTMNPLYVICRTKDGHHAGSMRFLPTVGRTMVNDHFKHLNGTQIVSPLIWECTRFCISPNTAQSAKVAANLMLAGCALGLRFGLTHSIGVFDSRMIRIYRRIGWSPEIIGTSKTNEGMIAVGLWDFSESAKLKICAKFEISPHVVDGWFDQSFRPTENLLPIAA